jgi:predicted AAA+ superfamily ATPase
MRELIYQLASTLTTPVSLQTLSQKTSMGSHHTAAEYLSILEGCFALRTLYALDADRLTPRFRSNKKFYFTDPLLLRVATEWAGVPFRIEEASIAEMVAHEELARRFGPSPPLGFLSTPKGEVDFVHRKKWALEVKWAPFAHNLSKAFLSLSWPRKSVWHQSNFLDEFPSDDQK